MPDVDVLHSDLDDTSSVVGALGGRWFDLVTDFMSTHHPPSRLVNDPQALTIASVELDHVQAVRVRDSKGQ